MTVKNKKLRLPPAIEEIVSMIGKNQVSIHAAAADYYIFMALVPVLMLLVSLIRYLPLNDSEVIAYVMAGLPESVAEVINRLLAGIYKGASTAMTVSILLTVFSASAAMRAIMTALDAVYADEEKSNIIVFWVRSFIYMILFTLLVIFCFALLIYGGKLWEFLHALLPESGIVNFIFGAGRYLHYIFVLAVLTVAFTAMYCFLPCGKHKMKHQWLGGAFCGLAWLAFSSIFSLYVSLSDKFGAYGYIGSIMVALMWMYYCLMFLLIGGCINRYVELKAQKNS